MTSVLRCFYLSCVLAVSACASGVKPLPTTVEAVPVVEIIRLGERNPATTALATLAYDIPPGTPIGEVTGGELGGCKNPLPITFSHGNIRTKTALYDPVFREVMELAEIPVEQIPRFAGEEVKKADLQVAATLKEMAMNLCFPKSVADPVQAIGEAFVKIEWALFSPQEKKVVFTAETSGRTPSQFTTRLGETGIVREAFRAALVQLAALPTFADAVARQNQPSQSASTGTISLRQPAARRAPFGKDVDAFRGGVVTVRSNAGEGSGFAIGDGSYLVTAAHVVSGDARVKLIDTKGKQIDAKVIRTDKGRDLALLKVTGARFEPLHLSSDAVKEGHEVFAMGSPLGEKFSLSVTRGIVGGLRRIDDRDYIQSDVLTLPGSSGGPLVDANGNVVGVSCSGASIHGIPAGMNFFIPARDIAKSLSLSLK